MGGQSQFQVGDFVTCPLYGVGQVTALDTYAGKPRCLVDFGFQRNAERTPGISPRYYHWHRMAAELTPWNVTAPVPAPPDRGAKG